MFLQREGAINDFYKILKENYSLFGVLVIIEGNYKKNKIVENIKNIVRRMETLILPQNCNQVSVISKLVRCKLNDDIGAIVVVGNEYILKSVSDFKIPIYNIITKPYYPLFTYDYNNIVDFNIISKCSHSSVTSSYGYFNALSFFAIEQVFNNIVLDQLTDTKKLLSLEKIIINLSNIVPAIIHSKLGIMMLTKACISLRECLDIERFTNSFVYNVAENIISLSKYKNIDIGQALAISNVISFKMFNILVNCEKIKFGVGYSISKRINLYQNDFQNFNNFNLIGSNLDKFLSNFNTRKSRFKAIFCNYYYIASKMLKCFKFTCIDNAISLNKYLNCAVLTKAVNKTPEDSKDIGFSLFLRDIGLLNKLD